MNVVMAGNINGVLSFCVVKSISSNIKWHYLFIIVTYLWTHHIVLSLLFIIDRKVASVHKPTINQYICNCYEKSYII